MIVRQNLALFVLDIVEKRRDAAAEVMLGEDTLRKVLNALTNLIQTMYEQDGITSLVEETSQLTDLYEVRTPTRFPLI